VAANGNGFRRSLAIQARVIGALLMREILTRYGRHNIGFMWVFVEPMLFTLGVAGLWTLLKLGHSHQINIVSFALTGYSSVLLWRNAVNRCNLAIAPNLSLMYHRNVRVIDVFAARLILEISGATISLIVLSIIFISIGWMDMPADVLTVVLAWLMLAWFAVGLGLVIGSISERSEVIDRIWHTITYLMFPLSGAVFMLSWLPAGLREILVWVPMVHGVEMLREGYYGEWINAYYNLVYFSAVNLILLLTGLALARQTQMRVEPE
jgi:capsular polysaccharide transport system permease protein